MAKLKFDLEKAILEFIKNNPHSSSREIDVGLWNVVAFATIKRTIAALLDKNLVATNGKGKATKYFISQCFEVLFPLDVAVYFEKEIDEREIKEGFNFDLFKEILNEISLFTNDEMEKLSNL